MELMKKFFPATFGILVFFILTCQAPAAPGLLQTASRAKFWCNDFPDTLLFLQNVYVYRSDEYADSTGKNIDINDTEVFLTLSRFIRPWHFGNRNQFQYILEGILVYQNIHIEKDNRSDKDGIGDPIIYQSFGWNNASKTTHLTIALVSLFPLGDNELRGIGDDSIRIMPLFAWLQRIGSVWLEACVGYYHYFDERHHHNTYGKDYFEYNAIVSYHFNKWHVYLQGDYKDTRESKYRGVNMHDNGYNVALSAGLACSIGKNMELNLKYVQDVDGKDELQGQGLNFRLAYFF